MKTILFFALALVWSSGALAQEAAGDRQQTQETGNEKSSPVPSTIDFQGRLHDSDGNPVNAILNITFLLYDVLSGGTAMWTETKSVQIVDGLFQVKLGEGTPLTPTHFSGSDRWLGIQVETEAEMDPRTKISSTAYSLQTGAASGIWTISGDDIYYDDGNVGIGINAPTALLHLHGNETGGGNVLFTGELKETDPGDPPVSDVETRFLWYPDKAAFKTGTAHHTLWEKEAFGYHSFSTGRNTKASGDCATALGYGTHASGAYSTATGCFALAEGSNSFSAGFWTQSEGNSSTALGSHVRARGDHSLAMGVETETRGDMSIAAGHHVTAHGNASVAFGFQTFTKSFAEMVIGRLPTDYSGDPENWVSTDRLFVIANGEFMNPSNALTVLKNGKVGIGTDTPTALLHTQGDETGGGNVLFTGEFKETDSGDPPASGSGTRMMWYPDKAAFRAGYVEGDLWDKTNIGNYSVAMGENTIASGLFSVAMGQLTTASGHGSIALGYNYTIASGNASIALGLHTRASGTVSISMGYDNTASGNYSIAMGIQSAALSHASIAMGDYSKALADYSTAIGAYSIASGKYSTATGKATIASSENSTAIGRFNIGGGNPDSWIETDPLFEIGNGISGDERQNALTVLKNGDMGIGTHTPTALLHTHGTDPGKGNVLFVGEFKKTNPGDPPTEGSGTRMMWYPDKGAFRAGVVEGNQWDKENIGDYSLAAGFLTMASGEASFAMGAAASASGDYSTALGYYASAPGERSTAIGLSTTAASYASLAVGSGNVGGGNANSWIDTDPLFEIGNGTFEQPRNALTVLKNGKTGIGTTAPPARLSIQGAGSNPTLPGVASSGVLRIGILFNEGIDIGKQTAAPHTGWIQSGSDGTFADPLSLQPLGGNLGIGTTSPSQTLDVNGQIRIRGGSPGAGKVLTSDANGVASWTTPTISLPFSGTTSAGTFGISINHTATSGTTNAGIFTSNSTSGTGVKGVASATSGTNYGGYFSSASASGYGALGQSPKFGVFGKSTGNQGRAVTGEATGTASIGVRGVALNTNSTGVWGEGSNYDFYANGPGVDYGTGSSIRWKRNIIAIPEPLEKIAALRGVYFDWDEEHGGRHDIGMIAEEVGKVLPEIVIYEENGIDAMGMDYSKIGPLLVEAVKALKAENDQLKARLERLEKTLESMAGQMP